MSSSDTPLESPLTNLRSDVKVHHKKAEVLIQATNTHIPGVNDQRLVQLSTELLSDLEDICNEAQYLPGSNYSRSKNESEHQGVAYTSHQSCQWAGDRVLYKMGVTIPINVNYPVGEELESRTVIGPISTQAEYARLIYAGPGAGDLWGTGEWSGTFTVEAIVKKCATVPEPIKITTEDMANVIEPNRDSFKRYIELVDETALLLICADGFTDNNFGTMVSSHLAELSSFVHGFYDLVLGLRAHSNEKSTTEESLASGHTVLLHTNRTWGQSAITAFMGCEVLLKYQPLPSPSVRVALGEKPDVEVDHEVPAGATVNGVAYEVTFCLKGSDIGSSLVIQSIE